MNKKVLTISILVVLSALLVTGLALAADDGPLFTRNLSRTPETLTGASAMSTMWLYVPAQDTEGEPPVSEDGRVPDGELGYFAGDCKNTDTSACELIYSRAEAKPLIVTYNDGIEDEELNAVLGIDTGAGFGERDGFAAVSLDDGATWKNVNLSNSADRSSFTLKNGEPYPGDVFKMVQQVEGNQVVAAWISRYCETGNPLYAWDTDRDLSTTEDTILGLLDAYPELGERTANIVDVGDVPVYTSDLFGVAGTQKSVDYTAQGFPEVGEIPYGCVWTARGTLEQDLDDAGAPLVNNVGDPVYDITWRVSERLTSGRRDPHQISITSSPGAGFVIFWQEDPAGLRPGKGLGPGEGWSGAIANSKTDIWYTYLDLAHFGDVCLDDVDDDYCTTGTLADYTTSDLFGTKPKAAVPFAMPVRITDNNQCKQAKDGADYSTLEEPYCFADFNADTAADFCDSTVEWENPGGTKLEVCVTEDGRPLTGRTASTRVRAAMKPYTRADGTTSAWVLFGAEKMKALGTVGDGGCDPTTDPECTVFDIGKNMWYYTFEFDNPALVTQGLMLNSPAISPETGEPFVVYDDPLTESEIYDTEIARRFNLMVNSPSAMQDEDTSGTAGILIYKQGILFQGGPADIFTRRIVLPPDTEEVIPCNKVANPECEDEVVITAGFDPAVDNPFAYENVECISLDDAGVATPVDRWYPDGVNPNYVLGLCPVDGMNVSSTTLVRCSDGSSGEACADQFPFSDTYEEWFAEDSQIQIPKVLEWSQTVDNLNDASWVNPYDVSKGHRGFMDGDFVMMMYATAANWKANTTGNEAYQLYIRRSFDGGVTWTTLPGDYAHWSALNPYVTITADGTETCEWYGGYTEDDYSVCLPYGAGEFEQARNVSQLAGTRVTVLDPRYSPSGGMLKKDYTKLLCYDETAVPTEIGDAGTGWVNCEVAEADAYPEDIRDPSAFFATFETGDNSVVTEETGTVPLDMYYSRASNFGDDWDEQDICNLADTEESWYPSASVVCGDDDVELRWDWLENGADLATEASVYGNPNGDRFYAVWNQELPIGVDEHGEDIFTNMDSEFRRIFYNFNTDALASATIDYVSATILNIEAGDVLEIHGSGRDHDHIGLGEPISAYAWFDEDLGVWYCTIDDWKEKECKDQDEAGACTECEDLNANGICDDKEWKVKCEQTLNIDAQRFGKGRHTINFAVQDNDGSWSSTVDTVVWVTEDGFIRNFIPAIIR